MTTTGPRPLISASSFYNLSKCQRRVWMDLHGDPAQKGEHSEFLDLLWERGVRIEREIIDAVKGDRVVIAVEGPAGPETYERTLGLMASGADLIYQGVLLVRDRVGRPDLLERVSGKSRFGDYQYVPCDVKSGRATKEKGGDEVKSHYANQMLFYCDLLENVQGVRPLTAKIIDAGRKVSEFPVAEYERDFDKSKALIERIVYTKYEPEPIIGGVCKDCVWAKPCREWAETCNDMTLLFELGKQKYALKDRGIRTIADVAAMEVSRYLDGDAKIPGVGEKTLSAWKRRAKVWQDGAPVIHTRPTFKPATYEVYYDVEDDPSIDHVYLHGLIEVVDGAPRPYRCYVAKRQPDELSAARQMWDYIDSLPDEAVIYHYGSYEKTKLGGLARKYDLPRETLEKFDRLRVDLYRILESSSDWPLSSYGIKDVAKHLGFRWTAEDASGANSIAWYTDYCKDPTNGAHLFDKILTYNREDCEAMIEVKKFLTSNGAS